MNEYRNEVRKLSNTMKNIEEKKTMTEQIQDFLHLLVAIATGKSAYINADITGAWPEPLKEKETPVKVTPAKARAALARYIKGAASNSKFCDKMRKNMIGSKALLTTTYTIGAGKNKGTQVPALAYGLVRIRREGKRAERQAKRQADLAAAQNSGGVFFATGVQDKEGVGIPYPNETKARKAWCRLNYGSDWWATSKGDRLAEAVITQGTYAATETHEVINETTTTVTTHDETLIAAARTLGSKATTIKGAKAFLAKQL